MRITTELAAALAGRYVVEREVGRGGMAVVYLARDTKHDRLVAVKVGGLALGRHCHGESGTMDAGRTTGNDADAPCAAVAIPRSIPPKMRL